MTILSFKNSLLDANIAARQLPYWDFSAGSEVSGRSDRGIMTDADISRIIGEASCYYLSNQLVLNLTPAPEEAEISRFKTNIGDSPGPLGFNTYWRTIETTDRTREWGNWSLSQYGRISGGSPSLFARYVSVSPTQIVIELPRISLEGIRHRDSTFSIFPDPLEFGILVLPVEFIGPTGEEYTNYFGIKITTNEVFSPSLEERREERPPRENEYKSPVYSFENLFIPTVNCSFVYNFYELNESDYNIISRRNYSGEKLRDIPKYNEVSWTKAPAYAPPLVAATGVRARSDVSGSTESGGGLPEGPPAASEDLSTSGPAAGGTAAIGGFVFVGRLGGVGRDGSSDSSESERSSGTDADLRVDLTTLADERVGIEAGGDRLITEVPTPEIVFPRTSTGYAGYIVQKERYDEGGEEFVPVDLTIINGRNNTKLIDWKIAYGEIYRYKVRSVFRFVNQNRLSMYADSDEIIDTTAQFATFDENSISSFDSYFYDSKFSENCEIEAVEFVKPDPPENVQIYPNSKEKSIFITWNQKNQNKDVLGFNIYKRKIEERFFRKINSEIIDIRSNFWTDFSLEKEQAYVYAVETIDVHYNFSNLSAQYSARILSQNLDILQRCEELPKFIKEKGKILEVREIDETVERTDNFMFFDDKFKIKVNPLYSSLERSGPFILKIKSLDTFMEKEIKINFGINTIYHKAPRSFEERVAAIGGPGALQNERLGGPTEGRVEGRSIFDF